MSKEAMIRARTEPDLKEKVELIFQDLGMNATTAINLFYKQVALHNGLPFDVRIPNATTLRAMREAKAEKTSRSFKSAKSMMRDLMIDD